MLLVHLLVCFVHVRVSFCRFSLPLGVGCWLRFVTVALPGIFFKRFFICLVGKRDVISFLVISQRSPYAES